MSAGAFIGLAGVSLAVVIVAVVVRRLADNVTAIAEILSTHNNTHACLIEKAKDCERRIAELEKGLKQATDMAILAHRKNAEHLRRIDGITARLGRMDPRNKKETEQ